MTNIFLETKRLYIRNLNDSDYDLVKQIYDEDPFLQREKNDSKLLYDTLIKARWKQITVSSTLNGMIFDKKTDEFCGRICMQKTDTEHPELGIELLSEKQNKKIGPEAIIAFSNWYCNTYEVKTIYIRIEENNMHSRHVFEKLGAVYEGRSLLLPESTIQKMEEILPDFNREEAERRAPFLLSLKLPI